MQEIDNGHRRLVTIDGENFYLYVSKRAVFCTVPRENDPIMTKTRQIAETICQEITRFLEDPEEWEIWTGERKEEEGGREM